MTETREEAHVSAIPGEIMEEACELARGAEILPDGARGLARKLVEAKGAGRKLRVKLGVDPTSTDLHVGHAVVFRKLRRFQEFGHQIVLIIGGFTAQIGDPTGRNSTRPPLTQEQVSANARTYLDQMGLILDMAKTEVLNNNDWLGEMKFPDVLKLAGSVTANQLLAKEAFGERLDNGLPVGFHELFYPLLQAYDSVAVQADVELGGTDQRFNILQGRELQPSYGQSPQVALLMPLLEGTDGVQKMSKSFGNYIGLREEPDDMFGKCMRIPDGLIVKYFELATTLSGAEIDAIKNELAGGANPKDLKERLAGQIVELYHGGPAAVRAREEWRRVHSQRLMPEDMPSYVVAAPVMLFRLLADAGLSTGTAEAKRLVAEGAVRLDGAKQSDALREIPLPGDGGSVLQVGRRKFVRLISPP